MIQRKIYIKRSRHETFSETFCTNKIISVAERVLVGSCGRVDVFVCVCAHVRDIHVIKPSRCWLTEENYSQAREGDLQL